MTALRQYQLVRVSKLLGEPAAYDGWGVNQRHPAVGDVGTIVDILETPSQPERYVVESSAPDGSTIWLADFRAEEIDPAEDGAERTDV